jgi:hypothetical protein
VWNALACGSPLPLLKAGLLAMAKTNARCGVEWAVRSSVWSPAFRLAGRALSARVAAWTLAVKFFALCDFKERRCDAHASWALTAGMARPRFAYLYDAREWVGLREFWRIFK